MTSLRQVGLRGGVSFRSEFEDESRRHFRNPFHNSKGGVPPFPPGIGREEGKKNKIDPSDRKHIRGGRGR